jgi:TetR/AcrR family transcriptional repressor of nem operon
MRYPDGHKESVRERIVQAASRALRREGLDAVSIPKLMKMAGLTHGGFYAHFRDRDELVADAVAFAAAETEAYVFGEADRSASEAFRAYLSKEHLNHPERGCVMATLGAEGRRQDALVRRAFANAAVAFLRHVERKLHPMSKRGTISDDSLAAASRMIGAMVLARLVCDRALSDRILAAAQVCDGQ